MTWVLDPVSDIKLEKTTASFLNGRYREGNDEFFGAKKIPRQESFIVQTKHHLIRYDLEGNHDTVYEQETPFSSSFLLLRERSVLIVGIHYNQILFLDYETKRTIKIAVIEDFNFVRLHELKEGKLLSVTNKNLRIWNIDFECIHSRDWIQDQGEYMCEMKPGELCFLIYHWETNKQFHDSKKFNRWNIHSNTVVQIPFASSSDEPLFVSKPSAYSSSNKIPRDTQLLFGMNSMHEFDGLNPDEIVLVFDGNLWGQNLVVYNQRTKNGILLEHELNSVQFSRLNNGDYLVMDSSSRIYAFGKGGNLLQKFELDSAHKTQGSPMRNYIGYTETMLEMGNNRLVVFKRYEAKVYKLIHRRANLVNMCCDVLTQTLLNANKTTRFLKSYLPIELIQRCNLFFDRGETIEVP